MGDPGMSLMQRSTAEYFGLSCLRVSFLWSNWSLRLGVQVISSTFECPSLTGVFPRRSRKFAGLFGSLFRAVAPAVSHALELQQTKRLRPNNSSRY